MQSGLIFDIKRYAINDGPGIRVAVFFKGCPLHCAWCHNPESISTQIQKMYSKDKCIGCNSCIENCPEKACQLTPEGIITDLDLCTGCGICADVCPTKATEMSGKLMSVDEIVSLVEKERIFFDQSGGGVTFSGGEPLMQAEFLIGLLDECGKRFIHRTVDTTGYTSSKTLLEVAKRTDLFLYDLKLMDTTRHKQWTGVGNDTILNNLKLLANSGASIEIRIPLVRGVNDDKRNISQTAEFIANLDGPKKNVRILPYHDIMANKYEKLGQKFNGAKMSEPGSSELSLIIDTFAAAGLHAEIGG